MILKPLSYAYIIAIAEVWRDIGGSPEVEIGALEPLLWKDGQYRIHDIVKALAERNFKISITTNGQLLDMFAEKLSRAGLSLIRTSWHSTNSLIFREISGGYGDYERFVRGVIIALESGIKVAFNRILLKGYTDDIPEQISFVENHRCRLKLYTLLWTPQNALTYEQLYQDWQPIIRKSVLPRTLEINRVRNRFGRGRLRFHLISGGTVEVKIGHILNRNNSPCIECSFKNKCEEMFGDYVRVDPRLFLYFCYIHRDLGFQLQEYFGRSNELKHKIQTILGPARTKSVLSTTPLRLTITPFCNFNCRTPGTKYGWCMEENKSFIYPKIKNTLLNKK